LWLYAALAPVVAIAAVDLTRRKGLRFLLLAGVIVVVAAGVVLVVSGLSPGRLLSVVGLGGRAAVPGLVTIAVSGAIGLALALVEGFRPSGRAVLLGTALGTIVVSDAIMVTFGIERANALRDLRLYLIAGERFLEGLTVYQVVPMTELPTDQALYPFLYPPPLLPVVGLLSQLPWLLVGTASIVGSAIACVAALRLVGVRWLWIPIFLLWPPFLEAIWVGNVVVYGLLVLAIAVWRPRRAGSLVAGPLFKPQFAIPALWLVRGRRWRALIEGLVAVGIVVLLTLPFVGIGAWVDWVRGVTAFQETVAATPILYSFALPRDIPYAAFLVLAAAAVVWGLLPRGLTGLRRLGVASVVASPTLYRHGLLEMIPAMVVLDLDLLLIVLGSLVSRLGLWIGVVVVIAGLSVPRRQVAGERVPST
jgi:glycosyl transferase family 87